MEEQIDEELFSISHEIWASAQLMPDEGIIDGVMRIYDILDREKHVWK